MVPIYENIVRASIYHERLYAGYNDMKKRQTCVRQLGSKKELLFGETLSGAQKNSTGRILSAEEP